ncbi:flagellin [Thermomicrobiaceae bacterium CFH 74404]|uniref:Flagellin n=1 Tax=Thermalbibacter longus TaxID=2951981 RepID=A0AA42BBC4_9BACT|nr:flagellin [Thermalbibacter longus]MCM8749610.1 flagellin [Thermalbibacter longus]
MRIYNNVNAVNAQRNLSITGFALAKSIEKLSSGLRINRAADDAAGLSISEKLRAQVRGLAQAMRNAQDGISMIQTAEGALNEVHSMLQRMRELAVQASNDTLSTEDRQAINRELQQLQTEINAISSRTTFNGKQLLTGSLVTQVDATSELKVGTTLTGGTDTAHVYALDVSAAAPGRTYTFAYNATTDQLTLTRSGDNVSQTIVLNAIAAGGSQTLNFGELGVSLTITSTGGITADNLGTALTTAATDSILTASTSGSANFQVGANQGDSMTVSFAWVEIASADPDLDTRFSDLYTALNSFDSSQSVGNAQALITAVDGAIVAVNEVRSTLGAAQNRLEHTIANLGVAHENLLASESRIRDVDMAAEMVNFTRGQILQQAGIAVLAQANTIPQSVLQLLR